MSLGGTLTTFAAIEKKAEDLLTQNDLCVTLRQERDACKALLALFRDQQIRKSRLWTLAGGVFLRTDKAATFTRTMKTLEDTLAQLKKAEAARTALARELLKDPGLSVIASDPRVNQVLSDVLEDDS